MATRSLIGMQVENGIKTMYCHYDGHLTGVGTTLLTHYTDPAKVAELVELGYISSLGDTPVIKERPIGCKDWDGSVCDAANSDIPTVLLCGASLSDLWDANGQEWEYLFTREGKWLVRKSEFGREVGEWLLLIVGKDGNAVQGHAYETKAGNKPAKKVAKTSVATTMEPATLAADSDSFLGLFARFGDLPAAKREKVLPALKALLEMAEG